MLPAIVLIQAELNLDERTPLRPLRLANQMHARFLWCPICFAGIALDTGANNIFPGRRPAPIPRDYVIQIQILAIEHATTILAGVLVPLENIVACKLDFFLRQMVINH